MLKNFDVGGIIVSVICVFHCILIPLSGTIISISSLNIFENIWIELLLILSTGIIGFLALRRGKPCPRKKRISIMFSIGFMVLISKLFFPEKYEVLFSVIALTIIITTHILNFQFHKKNCATS